MRIFNKNKSVVLLLIVLIQFVFLFPSKTYAVTTRVDLLTTDNFAVLAGSAITNTGTTTITGDIGSSPTSTETGFGSVTIVDGANHTSADPNDAVTVTAKTDLVTAYDDAAGRPTTATIDTELGGSTLTDGVYNSESGTFGITGTLTLDAQGNSNAVFIFKTSTGEPGGYTLITAGSSKVVLINGAQACNVFWQVGSSVTLGTSTSIAGTILVLTSITDTGSSTVNGRLLARNGAVTLNNTTVTKEVCAIPTSSPTPILTPTPNPTSFLTPIFTPTPTSTSTPTSSPSSSSSSSTSGSSSVSTPVCTDLAPTNNPNLFQINRTGSKAVLYFTPVNDYLTYYYIAYGLSQGSEQYGVSFSSGLTSGVVSYTINDLDPNETYYFKVRGGNGCMPGGWSNDKESNLKNPNLPNTGMGPPKPSVLWPISLGMFLSGCLVYLIRKNYRFI